MENKEEQPKLGIAPLLPKIEPAPAVKVEEKKPAEQKEEEKKKEEGKKFEEGMSISPYVKAEFVQQLLDVGFSKTVAEKALYLTGGASVEKALEWIEQHQEEPDFQEELRIVG